MRMEQKYINRRRATVALPLLALSGVVVGNRLNDVFNVDCSGAKVLTISEGDTLWEIADEVKFGNPTDKRDVVSYIIDQNPSIDIGNLAVGTVVTIPEECK